MEDALHSILAQNTPTDNRNVWIALVVAATAVLWMTFRSFKTKKDPLANKPFRMNLSQQKSLEHDMQNLLVELSSMTRQMNAQLETRAAKIELLIADADKRIEELKRLGASDVDQATLKLNALRQMDARPNSRAIDAPVDLSRLGFASKERSETKPVDVPEKIETGDESLPETRPDSRPESRSESRAEPNIEPVAGRHADVYRLADEGLNAQQIAQKLSRPRGEIELLLALYRPWPNDHDETELPKIAMGE